MPNKFPGSWWKVAALCGVIIAGQAARAVLLRPTMIRLAPAPAVEQVEMKASTESANLVSSSASDAMALVERYESQFTPELDARARLLAEQLELPVTRLPTARAIFMLLAGRNLLVEPTALMADMPEGWEVVCGDQPPDYVCLTITSHIRFLAEHDSQMREGRQRMRGGN